MVAIRDFLRPKEFVAELLGDWMRMLDSPFHAGTFLMVLVGKAAAVSLAQVEVSRPPASPGPRSGPRAGEPRRRTRSHDWHPRHWKVSSSFFSFVNLQLSIRFHSVKTP